MSTRDSRPDGLSPRQDDVYQALMTAHDGLSQAESHALNARLVLLMANEIGDADRIIALFRLARSYGPDHASPS